MAETKEKMAPEGNEEKEREKPIPQSKINLVSGLSEKIKNSKTVMVASIRGLPAKRLQEINKKLRGQAEIKVPKKTLFSMAVDSSGVEVAKELKDKIDVGIAVIFSNQEVFDLASDLLEYKTPAEAKPGQEAPEDVVVKEGPTDLPPGPAITELQSAGLNVQIEKGKVSVKEESTLAKAGEEISESAANVMSKLGMKPFSIGVIPLYAIDTNEGKYYSEVKIDPEEAKADLLKAYERALPFAVEMGYTTSETISYILTKAEREAKAMESFTSSSEEKENSEGSESEESSEKESGESSESQEGNSNSEDSGKSEESQGNSEGQEQQNQESSEGQEASGGQEQDKKEDNTQQENKSQGGN